MADTRTKAKKTPVSRACHRSPLARLQGDLPDAGRRTARDQMKGEFKMTAQEIIEQGLFNAAVELMDDEIREAVHQELSPCSDEEFLTEYMKRHAEKYGVDFVI